ncbi:unnamed protein product [Chrysoparadoxa australica]
MVVKRGLDATVRWWKDKAMSGSGHSNKLKVVLVGEGRAGKTSLLNRIRDPKATLQKPCEEGRILCVDLVKTHVFGHGNGEAGGSEGAEPLKFKFWDFAGQEEYYAYHEIFLTKQALYILVVDLHAFSELSFDKAKGIYRWLDALDASPRKRSAGCWDRARPAGTFCCHGENARSE